MTTTLVNNAEGIANGTTITTGVSATGGNAFSAVTPGAGGTIVATSTTPITGSISYLLTQGTAACVLEWQSAVLPALATSYHRFTATLSALPTASAIFWKGSAADTTEAFRLEILSTGILRLRNGSTGALLVDSATALPVGAAFRVELKIVHGTSGTAEVRIYLTKDSVAPTEVLTPPAANLNTDLSKVQMGRTSSTPAMPAFRLDDLGVTDTTWFGPPVTFAAPTAAFTSSAAGLLGTFTDGSSAAGGRTIASRAWSFGDGGTSTATNPTHTYLVGGSYTVNLTVTDDLGRTSNVTHSIVIQVPSDTGKPIAVTSAGGYTPVGAGDLLTALSDTDPTSFAVSPTSGGTARVQMSSLLKPAAGTDATCTVECDRTGATTGTIIAKLYEGATVRSTTSSQTLAAASSGDPMTISRVFTFPASDLVAIADASWPNSNIYVELVEAVS